MPFASVAFESSLRSSRSVALNLKQISKTKGLVRHLGRSPARAFVLKQEGLGETRGQLTIKRCRQNQFQIRREPEPFANEAGVLRQNLIGQMRFALFAISD
jgi:hypothetical protein